MATAKEKMDIIVTAKGTETSKKKLGGVEKSIGSMAKGALAGVASFYALKKAYDIIIGSAAQFEKVGRQMDAVLKSTKNAAGMTKKELLNLADSFQNVTTYSNTSVMEAENLILTFTKIGKRIMPDAIETVLNMSTALGQDLKSSAIQVGKALNDPITGATALRRVGVSLTDQQIKQIKVLQQNNDLFGAQKIILDELATEFGGAAKAAVESFSGATAQTANIISDFARSIGEDALPGLTNMTKGIGEFFLKLQETTLETTIRQLKEMGVEAEKIADLQFLSDWDNATEALLGSNKKITDQLQKQGLGYKRIAELSNLIDIETSSRLRAKTQETIISHKIIIDQAKVQALKSKDILDIMERIRKNLNEQINYKDGINGIEGQIVIQSSEQMAILGDLLKLTTAKESAERIILGLKKEQNKEDKKVPAITPGGTGAADAAKKKYDNLKEGLEIASATVEWHRTDVNLIQQNVEAAHSALEFAKQHGMVEGEKLLTLYLISGRYESIPNEIQDIIEKTKNWQTQTKVTNNTLGDSLSKIANIYNAMQNIANLGDPTKWKFKDFLSFGLGAVGAFTGLKGLLGFQHGGSFNVGGSGGTDSQFVAFRATPGEQVTINKPNQSNNKSLTINVFGNFTDVDQLAAEIAERSNLGFNRIAVS